MTNRRARQTATNPLTASAIPAAQPTSLAPRGSPFSRGRLEKYGIRALLNPRNWRTQSEPEKPRDASTSFRFNLMGDRQKNPAAVPLHKRATTADHLGDALPCRSIRTDSPSLGEPHRSSPREKGGNAAIIGWSDQPPSPPWRFDPCAPWVKSLPGVNKS
jgi:hypothetical protein